MRLACADLHPGNILVALDPPPGPLLSSAAYVVDRFKPFGWKVPSSWREPAIVLLDVGECFDLGVYASSYYCRQSGVLWLEGAQQLSAPSIVLLDIGECSACTAAFCSWSPNVLMHAALRGRDVSSPDFRVWGSPGWGGKDATDANG